MKSFTKILLTLMIALLSTTVSIAQLELDNCQAPGVVFAESNQFDSEATISWGTAFSDYFIVYDDDIMTNQVAWQFATNINALKFTPNSYPCEVKGGYIHIGDGIYPPAGDPIQPFRVVIYDDDGLNGMPGTELTSMTVTPTAAGWVPFVLPASVEIANGDFYIGQVQLSDFPNAAPIGIDGTTPVYRSYVFINTLPNGSPNPDAAWKPAGYYDFMMRALVAVPVSSAKGSFASNNKIIEPERRDYNQILSASPLKTLDKRVQEQDGYYIPVDGSAQLPTTKDFVGYNVYVSDVGYVPTNPNASTWTLITPTPVADFSFIYSGWNFLSQGWYGFAVEAVYTDCVSDMSYSNRLGKSMDVEVTFEITLSDTDASCEGIFVSMISQEDDPLNPGTPMYTYMDNVNGSCILVFHPVWVSVYDLLVSFPGYDTWTFEGFNLVSDTVIQINLNETCLVPIRSSLTMNEETFEFCWEMPMILTGLDENFDAGVLPEGWTLDATYSINLNPGNCNEYLRAFSFQCSHNPYYAYNSNFSGKCAMIDDDNMGHNGRGTYYIISPAIDLAVAGGGIAITLDYENRDYFGGGDFIVDVWNGTSWDELKRITYTATGSLNIDISAYSNYDFKVRFAFDDQYKYSYGVAFDNVKVTSNASPGTKGDVPKSLEGFNVYLDSAWYDYVPADTDPLCYTYDKGEFVYGEEYTVCVGAVYSVGICDTVCITFTARYLECPTGLTVVAGENMTTLTWTAPDFSLMAQAPDSVTYNIYRNGALVGNTNELTYEDMNLAGGNDYCYTVTAIYYFSHITETPESCATDEVCVYVEGVGVICGTVMEKGWEFPPIEGATVELVAVIDGDFQIVLWDTWGDGWNGNALDVLVNGVVVLDNITLLSNGTTNGDGPEYHSFTVEEGYEITTVYDDGGSWDSENWYQILDDNGNVVFTDGYGGYVPSGGTILEPALMTITTDENGAYCFYDVPEGDYNVRAEKLPEFLQAYYDEYGLFGDPQILTVTVTNGSDQQNVDIVLYENPFPVFDVIAWTNNDCEENGPAYINWYDDLHLTTFMYDDGEADGVYAQEFSGSKNALKFSTTKETEVLGGSVNIYNGLYPSGFAYQDFKIAIHRDYGGVPGTMLAEQTITPYATGWIDFNFASEEITIAANKDFWIVMTQLGDLPWCVPIAIDNSTAGMMYSFRQEAGSENWMPYPGEGNFMMRAAVYEHEDPVKGVDEFEFYRIYRLTEQQYIDYIADSGSMDDWTLLADNYPYTKYIDNDFENLPSGIYYYAIVSVYTFNTSDPQFSNPVYKGYGGEVCFEVVTNSGDPVAGTEITITLENGGPAGLGYLTTMTAVTGEDGIACFCPVWRGAEGAYWSAHAELYAFFDYDSESPHYFINTDDEHFIIEMTEDCRVPEDFYVNFQTGVATWTSPWPGFENFVVPGSDKAITGYELFMDGVAVAIVQDYTYTFDLSGVTTGDQVRLGIRTLCTTDESEIVEVFINYWHCEEFLNIPSCSVVVDSTNLNTFDITWESATSEYWLHDGNDGSFEGYYSNNTYAGMGIAQYFTISQAAALEKVRFSANFSASGPFEGHVIIYDDDGVTILGGPYTYSSTAGNAQTIEVIIPGGIALTGDFFVATVNSSPGGPWIGVDRDATGANTCWWGGPFYGGYSTDGGAFVLDGWLGSHEAYINSDGKNTVKLIPQARAYHTETINNVQAPSDTDPEGFIPKEPQHHTYNTSKDDFELLGYYVRRNGVLIATLGANVFEYTDIAVSPGGEYEYCVTAFFDLMVNGEYAESCPCCNDVIAGEGLSNIVDTEPCNGLDHIVDDHDAILFWCKPDVYAEPLYITGFEWDSINSDGWTNDCPDNWIIVNTGATSPQLQFDWAPPITDYNCSFISAEFDASEMETLTLNFDLVISAWTQTTAEKLYVEITSDGGTTWTEVAMFDMDVPTGLHHDADQHKIDITSAAAGETFQLRFRAQGSDSYDIWWWEIDNLWLAPLSTAKFGETLLGYNVWRMDDNGDMVFIGFTTDTTYTDPDLLAGVYEYSVSTVYAEGETSLYVPYEIVTIYDNGDVEGVVYDAATGEPIEGATVSVTTILGDASTTTGPLGEYMFENVVEGEQSFTASANGYNPSTIVAEVIIDDIIVIDFYLITDDILLVPFCEDWEDIECFAAVGWTLMGVEGDPCDDDSESNWIVGSTGGNPGQYAQFYYDPTVLEYTQSLVSPEILAQNLQNVTLKYDLWLRNYTANGLEHMSTEILIDEDWIVLSDTSNVADIPWTEIQHDITDYVTMNEIFKIRFNAYGVNSYELWEWGIDNVCVYESEVAKVSGFVTEVETGVPVSGATIGVQATNAQILTTTTNANGYYEIIIEQGSYDFGCIADGYCDVFSKDNVVDEDYVWNVELGSPQITVSPSYIVDAELTVGESETHIISITNDGNCDLAWSASIDFTDDASNPNPQQTKTPWISLSETSGTIDAAGSGSVDLVLEMPQNAEEGDQFNAEVKFYSPILDDSEIVIITMTTIVGVDNPNLSDLTIYPNPATTNVRFEFAGNNFKEVRIVNAIGQEIYYKFVTNDYMDVPVANFAAGSYMVKFFTEDGQVEVRKLVIAH